MLPREAREQLASASEYVRTLPENDINRTIIMQQVIERIKSQYPQYFKDQ